MTSSRTLIISLAELTEWEKAHEAWHPHISKTFKQGIALGARLRALGGGEAGEQEYNEVLQSYAAFVLNYETLWLDVQKAN